MSNGRLQAGNNASINDFFRLVTRAWDTVQQDTNNKLSESVASPNSDVDAARSPVKMYRAYPANLDTSVNLPAITYMFIKKTISEMREHRPRIRETFENTSDPDNKIIVTGQRFDYYVVFETWADTQHQVEDITEQLEEFITTYTSMFKQQGVVDIRFEETSLRRTVGVLPNYLENKRTMSTYYKVTIEKLNRHDVKTIEKITFKILEKE